MEEPTPKKLKYKGVYSVGKKVAPVETEETLRPEAMEAQYSETMKGTGKKYQSKREEMIADGLFTEKDGDLIPTEKYFRMKKSGELKGKYNIE